MFVLIFALALAAGLVAGRAMYRRPPPSTQSIAGVGDSTLAGQLQLSPDKAERMRPIWEAARDTANACAREADRIQRDNDAQLQALLTEQPKAKYEQISIEHHAGIVEQDARRKEAFRQAVEQTRAILRPDQWQAYEQILKNQLGSLVE